MCMGFRKCQARKTNTTSNIHTQHATRHKILPTSMMCGEMVVNHWFIYTVEPLVKYTHRWGGLYVRTQTKRGKKKK